MDNSIAKAAELEKIADDAAALAVSQNTREAHIRAKLALYAAGRAWAMLRQPDRANGFYRRALVHKTAAVALAADVLDLGELDGLAAELGL